MENSEGIQLYGRTIKKPFGKQGWHRYLVGIILVLVLVCPASADSQSPPAIHRVVESGADLWFFSEAEEIFRVDLDRRVAVRFPDTATIGRVYSTLDVSGELWVLTNRGLVRATSGESQPFAFVLGPWPADPAAGDQALRRCFRLIGSGQQFYLYGFTDVYVYDPASRQLAHLFHTRENITALVPLAGYLWFGTMRGLYRWTPGMAAPEEITPSACGLTAPFGIEAITLTEEGIYFATQGDGLLRFGLLDRVWSVETEEPFIFRLVSVGEGEILTLLPGGKIRRWQHLAGWSEVEKLPWGERSDFIIWQDQVLGFVRGGNTFGLSGQEGWQEFYLGADRLFYRGPGISLFGQSAETSEFRFGSGTFAYLLLGIVVSLVLGGGGWLYLARRRRAITHEKITGAEIFPWGEKLPPLPMVTPFGDYEQLHKDTGVIFKELEKKQAEMQAELKSLPPHLREQDDTREEYRGRLNELVELVERQQILVREWITTLENEIQELAKDSASYLGELKKLEERYQRKLITREEYRVWRRELSGRHGELEKEHRRRVRLQQKLEELVK